MWLPFVPANSSVVLGSIAYITLPLLGRIVIELRSQRLWLNLLSKFFNIILIDRKNSPEAKPVQMNNLSRPLKEELFSWFVELVLLCLCLSACMHKPIMDFAKLDHLAVWVIISLLLTNFIRLEPNWESIQEFLNHCHSLRIMLRVKVNLA